MGGPFSAVFRTYSWLWSPGRLRGLNVLFPPSWFLLLVVMGFMGKMLAAMVLLCLLPAWAFLAYLSLNSFNKGSGRGLVSTPTVMICCILLEWHSRRQTGSSLLGRFWLTSDYIASARDSAQEVVSAPTKIVCCSPLEWCLVVASSQLVRTVLSLSLTYFTQPNTLQLHPHRTVNRIFLYWVFFVVLLFFCFLYNYLLNEWEQNN